MICNRKNLCFLALAASALLFTACRKNADDIAVLLSESEAAEITETAVAERTAGATAPAVDMAQILETSLQTCGVPADTSFHRSNSHGAASYDYNFTLGWLINCTNLSVPTDATVDIAGNGSFNTARWSGSEQANGQLVFTGLAPSATEYIANGGYTLSGALTGDLRNVDPTLDCTTVLTLTNLTIRKSDYQITGGTGTVDITATNGQGRSESLSGTLVFNGNGTVTVTVNGHVHTFDL